MLVSDGVRLIQNMKEDGDTAHQTAQRNIRKSMSSQRTQLMVAVQCVDLPLSLALVVNISSSSRAARSSASYLKTNTIRWAERVVWPPRPTVQLLAVNQS